MNAHTNRLSRIVDKLSALAAVPLNCADPGRQLGAILAPKDLEAIARQDDINNLVCSDVLSLVALAVKQKLEVAEKDKPLCVRLKRLLFKSCRNKTVIFFEIITSRPLDISLRKAVHPVRAHCMYMVGGVVM